MGYEIDLDKAKDSIETLFQWMYWIIGILIAFVISYVLYTKFNKQVASILVFIAIMMALYYYYVKWFIIGDPYPVPQTTCPDFMTSIGLATGKEDQFICTDRSKVYPTMATSSELSLTAAVGSASYPTTVGNGGDVINTASGGGFVITPSVSATADEKNSFCTALKNNGISWISYCDY